MKFNYLVPVLCFVAAVVSCGAAEDASDLTNNSQIVSVSQALKSPNAVCQKSCNELKGDAKRACKIRCTSGDSGAGGSGGSVGTGGSTGTGGAGGTGGQCSTFPLSNELCDACAALDPITYPTAARDFVTNSCDGSCATPISPIAGVECNPFCPGVVGDCYGNCPPCLNN